MAKIIGSCSICGGNVWLEDPLMGTYTPPPSCESCGATKKNNLPVIEMEQKTSQKLLLS